MARVLLGVTGGIAAYKAVEFTRLATKAGHSVRVIATETAQRFVGTATFAGHHRRPGADRRVGAPTRCAAPSPATRCPTTSHPPTSSSSATPTSPIAPASANTIAKLAAGTADNLLTAAALAAATAGRGPGDERCDVDTPRRGTTSRACARAASGARARRRRARLAWRARRRPAARAA